eukprot:1498332-Prymnesium_polylepis.1
MGAAVEPAPFALPHGRCDRSRMTLDGVGDGWWVTEKSASATRRQLLTAGGWRSALRWEAAFKCEVLFADEKASIGGPVRPWSHDRRRMHSFFDECGGN